MPQVSAHRSLTQDNLIADYAERASRNPASLSASALRGKTPSSLHIMAYLATNRPISSQSLIEAAREWEPARLLTLIADHWWALEHMRIASLMIHESGTYAAAMRLYNILAGSTDIGADRNHLTFYAQIGAVLCSLSDALPLLADPRLPSHYRASTLSDLLNPFRADPRNLDTGAWLRAFCSALGHPPDDRLALRAQGPTTFDRLSGGHLDPIQQDQLISVITSTYNPDEGLLTAVRSMKSQTWQNWELLIVDDASDSKYHPSLIAAERLDPRVRVLRKAINGGTYRARNTALGLARGQFVTFLDSDDWAHPRFLEHSVRPLLETPSLVATTGWGARVRPDLLTTRLGYPTIAPAATTLMMRNPDVIDRIGFYDPVRKGADTEFSERIKIAFQQDLLKLRKSASILVRTGQPSLSSSDFSKGWRHSARRAYRMAYQDWHTKIETGSVGAYLDPLEPRPFPAPARWTDSNHRRFDVVIAGDWRQFGGPQRSMLEEIRACREAGLAVGVMHFEALRFMTSRDAPLCQPIRELINDGTVQWIHFDDDIAVTSLLLRYPPILQFPSDLRVAFTPQNLFIVANQAPAEPDGSDQRYIPDIVTVHAEKMFGRTPLWVPQGPSIRAALLANSVLSSLADWNNPGLIRVDDWSVDASHRKPTSSPVVGRYSRDNAIKFPSEASDLVKAYNFAPPFEVRMMGATKTVPRLLAESGYEMPSNWKLLPQGAVDVHEFLEGVDYFVYMDNPEAHEAFGRVLLEAAASGVLTIASEKHRETFGEALVYASPETVVGVVHRYPIGSESYRRRVRISQEAVLRQFSHESFARKLRSLALQSIADEQDALGLRQLQGPLRISVKSGRAMNVTAGGSEIPVVDVRSPLDGASASQLAIIGSSGTNMVDSQTVRRISADVESSPHGDSPLRDEQVIVLRDRSSIRIWTQQAYSWSHAVSDAPGLALVGRRDKSGTNFAQVSIRPHSTVMSPASRRLFRPPN